ncbi:MAG TPA: prohibitin family protein [Phnomibacter sp.]|nr:prohibitin family protein [Phnomibacter sp.]
MVLIILGVLLLLLVGVVSRNQPQAQRFAPAGRIIGFLMIALGIVSKSVVQVNAGEAGVKVLFGKVQPAVLGSGLHLINPLMEVRTIDIKTQNYTMSGKGDERHTVDDEIRVLTSDGLEVAIDLTVLYRVIPANAPRLLVETGFDYVDKVVRPQSRTAIRDNAVYYQAVELFSTKRDEFQARIYKSIESDFRKRGLLLEQLLVRNITLPASVRAAIEAKINAEQEAQKMQFVLQKERQEAERKRVEAQGISDYQRIINESLTERQLQYENIKAMKELAQSQNSKMIIMGRGNTPIILDGKQ